jgi:5-methyltetrahydropteroyltriglutamate--homocysteine methyltransferase
LTTAGAARRRVSTASNTTQGRTPMKTSDKRILTTHVGSLARPKRLLDIMKAKYAGQAYDSGAYEREITTAVAEVVAKQAECGIDVVADGEMSKPGFFVYIKERLDGFEPRPDKKHNLFAAEVAAFPEYYADYFNRAMLGGTVAPMTPMYCTGPIRYKGQAAIKKDIDNLKAALKNVDCTEAFIPAIAPSGAGYNEYYKTDEEYLNAVGEALRTEYQAIVDAGFILQVDDPFISDVFADPALDAKQMRKRADMYVEAINNSLRGIPSGKIRFHTCYGINEGPRIHEAALSQVAGHMLRVNADAYSFEGANCRHEHEYHLWESVKLPAGKIVIPGVITHASNIVEHPELIAERIVRYAKLVGRENVMAGADCGFSSQACYHTEVHPTVIWAKFQAMAEGARIASKQLWGRA